MKQFFKKLFATIYDLFIDSNRWFQMLIGGFLMVFMMAVIVIWTPYDPIALQCVFGATAATLIAMVFGEYKDSVYGNPVNWKDILAGMTIPIIIDILALVLLLC